MFSIGSLVAVSQSTSTTISATAMGIGNTSSCLGNEWSLMNNVGAFAKVETLTASFSQQMIPSFKPFGKIAAVCAVPLNFGVAGVGFYRFGDVKYNEQLVSLGFSNQFGLASLGLKANYVQYYAEGFGARKLFTISFGGLAEITPEVLIGAFIDNLNQPKFSADNSETLLTRFTAGIGLKPSKTLLATAEVEKDLINKPVVKAGLQYELNKKFTGRTGFNISPRSAFAGLGFHLTRFRLDYGIQIHEYFGVAHQASASVPIKRKR